MKEQNKCDRCGTHGLLPNRRYCNNLDGLVPDEYLQAVNQLHLTIDQESYNLIWAKPKGLDAF